MQFFWLYIDDLVGKGLDTFIILKLVGLVSVSMLTTAIPLALLFSSIMTFGNLGESFELIPCVNSHELFIRGLAEEIKGLSEV